MAPAKTCEVVSHGGGQISHIAVGINAERSMALRQFCAVRPVNQWNMCVDRQLPPHTFVNDTLTSCISQVVIPANNMCHAHVVIVHNYGQHIGRRPVGAQQNHVVQRLVFPSNSALDLIVNRRLALARGFQAYNIRCVRRRCWICVTPRRTK